MGTPAFMRDVEGSQSRDLGEIGSTDQGSGFGDFGFEGPY